MVAVQGLYKGGDTVTIDTSPLLLMGESYEVIVTFLHALQNSKARSDRGPAGEWVNRNLDKRQAEFQTFMKYKGSLPVNFDYREERYGHIN